MRAFDCLAHRLRTFFRSGMAEHELDRELRFHIESHVEELVARGMRREEAEAAAQRAFGGVDQVKESVRDTWGVRIVRDLSQDLRYAARTLRRAPTFTIVASLTVALGVGATTAIFTVVDAVLLKPLDYPDAHRIVRVLTHWTKTDQNGNNLSGPDLVDVRDGAGIFEAFSAFSGGEMAVRAAGHSELIGTWFVNASFFGVFRVQPAAGRTFRRDDVERAVVVSSGYAIARFGSSAAALGRTLTVDARTYEIVGVMPPRFHFPQLADVWVPIPDRPANMNRTGHNYPSVALLRPGVTRESADAAMATVSARIARTFPESNRDKTLIVMTLQERMVGPMRGTLYLLLGAVTLLFLIACANVANLFLARATVRSREIALRAALGASRWRVVRQLAVESLVVAAIGAVVGIALASLGTTGLVRLAPVTLPRLDEIAVDRTALGFSGLISLGATLVFGLAPAWHASRVDLRNRLVEGGSHGSVGAATSRLGTGLAIAEITLAVVLAIGGALLFRSFVSLTTTELGYQTSRIMTVRASAPAADDHGSLRPGDILRSARETVARYERLIPALETVPGVESAAAAMGVPLGDLASNGSFAIQGRHTFAPGQDLPYANFRVTSPGYFATLGIPLTRGRDFAATDTYEAPSVVIVSEALVRELFPDRDPLGQRIQCGLDLESLTWMTIVGVVGDIRDEPGTPPTNELYMPLAQHPGPGRQVALVIRSAVPPAALVETVRERIRRMDPEIATKFTTYDTWASNAVAAPRFRTWLVGVFATLALLLAAGGIYGLLTYLTAQRMPELGIRMALGAGRGQVIRLVLSRAAWIGGAGIVLGVAASLGSSRAITAMMFGVEPFDPVTYATVVAAVLAVTLGAAAVPAWRASRIDPAIVLRQ